MYLCGRRHRWLPRQVAEPTAAAGCRQPGPMQLDAVASCAAGRAGHRARSSTDATAAEWSVVLRYHNVLANCDQSHQPIFNSMMQRQPLRCRALATRRSGTHHWQTMSSVALSVSTITSVRVLSNSRASVSPLFLFTWFQPAEPRPDAHSQTAHIWAKMLLHRWASPIGLRSASRLAGGAVHAHLLPPSLLSAEAWLRPACSNLGCQRDWEAGDSAAAAAAPRPAPGSSSGGGSVSRPPCE